MPLFRLSIAPIKTAKAIQDIKPQTGIQGTVKTDAVAQPKATKKRKALNAIREIASLLVGTNGGGGGLEPGDPLIDDANIILLLHQV
jgi:hypothetical protein